MRKKRVPFFVKLLIWLVVIGSILGGAYAYVINHYEIKNVLVDGAVHYTSDEIKDIVMEGPFGNNSLYLSYKYKNREITDIPFVQTINIEIVSADTIRISVYEKALAGYIEYLGRYIYFDKDGIAVESSNIITAGVPEVVGVDFDYVIIYEKLPAEDENLFKKVLNVTQLLTKYQVKAEKMYFKPNGEIVLYYKDITINLGKDDNMDIKIMNLPSILSNLEGRKGILRMEDYSESSKTISFEPLDQ